MECRACQHSSLVSIIPLGILPLANGLLKEPALGDEPRYNLEVMLCEACGLAQLRDLVSPAALFTNYVYFSSHSETMLNSAKELVEKITPSLPSKAFIVEIASNDGYLLKNYVKKGFDVLGIDPAQNIAAVANEQGVPTLCDFFRKDLAYTLAQEGKQADVIHANNVMAHIPDINGFIEGLKILLKPQGFAVIEVPYFGDLVEKLEFDTIYHEHVYYFALKPLLAAFTRYGLDIFDCEKLAIHGGSLRLWIGHQGAQSVSPRVALFLEKEAQKNLQNQEIYHQFMEKLEALKKELLQTLGALKADSKIAAYGASAKGTTLLNFFGIGAESLAFVVDRSPAKQNLYTPGTHLKIRPPEALLHENIDYALLLTWNFAEEIITQQQAFRAKGGKFIIPLPSVKILP